MKKMRLVKITFLFIGLFSHNAISQSVGRCGTNELSTHIKLVKEKASKAEIRSNDKYRNSINSSLPNRENRTIENRTSNQISQEVVFEIPIRFYILGASANDKITDNDLESQLIILNGYFRNKLPIGPNVGVDTKIQFCSDFEVQRIQNFNYTTGDDLICLEEAWTAANFPVNNKYNIYISELTLNDGSWAKSVYPWYTNLLGGQDGTLIDPDYFGITNTSNFNKGKTLIHEAGHWLGLYHIYEGQSPSTGCHNNNPQADGDHVSDTPPQLYVLDNPSLLNNCDPRNTCPEPLPYVFDLTENFMDDIYDQCMNTFTTGQKSRMRTSLSTDRSNVLFANCSDEYEDFHIRSYFIAVMKITKEKDTNIFTGEDDVYYQSAEMPKNNCFVQRWGLEWFVDKFDDLGVWHRFENLTNDPESMMFLGSPEDTEKLVVLFYDKDSSGAQIEHICPNYYFQYTGENSPYGVIEIDPNDFNTPGETKIYIMPGAEVLVECRY